MADCEPICANAATLIASDAPKPIDPHPATSQPPVQVVVPPPSSPSSSTDSGVAAEDSQPSRDEESSQDDVTSESESSGSDMSQEGVSVELWIRRQISRGYRPRDILRLINRNFSAPAHLTDAMLWRLLASAFNPPRRPLKSCQSLHDFCQLLQNAKKIIVLCGAGVSTACGIPDFRSRDGIYQRLATEFPNLPDPQSMFDIRFFRSDPRPFFQFARALYPGQFEPSPTHRFMRHLEAKERLLRCYTQNIDTLERQAGLSRIVECHGSFRSATCTKCGHTVDGAQLREEIEQQRIPICHVCRPDVTSPLSKELSGNEEDLMQLVADGIYKPDIVFFGEGLPEAFHEAIEVDRLECDLLVVIGSSLKVKPVAQIPAWLPANVPQVLINREPLPHMRFDVSLYGDSDIIINHLSHMLGDDFSSLCTSSPLTETEFTFQDPPAQLAPPTAFIGPQLPAEPLTQSLAKQLPTGTFTQCRPRVYVFPGAELYVPDDEVTDSEPEPESDPVPPTKKPKVEETLS